jgi:hypothetical protein
MIVVAFALTTFALSAQELNKRVMTNQDVIDMVTLGLGDDVIISKIQAAPETKFDTELEALKTLKAAKVSDPVIRFMINPKAVVAAAPAVSQPTVPPANPDLPEDVGVYLKRYGKLVEVDPEVVGWRSGGVMKHIATSGLTKGHVNGVVQGPKSKMQLSPDAEFIIKVTEGTSIAEYQLLRLDMKDDRREFRSTTGGIVHQSGGAERNEEKYDSEKIAPRVFKVRLPALKKGEYGFLPPGSTSGNIASQGKLYTFGIE